LTVLAASLMDPLNRASSFASGLSRIPQFLLQVSLSPHPQFCSDVSPAWCCFLFLLFPPRFSWSLIDHPAGSPTLAIFCACRPAALTRIPQNPKFACSPPPQGPAVVFARLWAPYFPFSHLKSCRSLLVCASLLAVHSPSIFN